MSEQSHVHLNDHFLINYIVPKLHVSHHNSTTADLACWLIDFQVKTVRQVVKKGLQLHGKVDNHKILDEFFFFFLPLLKERQPTLLSFIEKNNKYRRDLEGEWQTSIYAL